MQRSTGFALALSLCLLGACKTKPTPAPEKEPQAVTKTESPPTPSAVVSAEAPAKVVPTLIPERFAPEESKPEGLFPVEGALMVAKEQRIGRIVDDKIEWIGKIPKRTTPFGDNAVRLVHGRWPDRIDVVYTTTLGRAPQPTYVPLTGKGRTYITGEGGSTGWIVDVATAGESTFVASFAPFMGTVIMSVRGKELARSPQSPEEAGCKGDELEKFKDMPALPALEPRAFNATDSGVLVTLGPLCDKRGPAMEVWDESGSSRIIDLSRWFKEMSYTPTILKSKGEELWLHGGGTNPILRYDKGTIEALPRLAEPISNIFRSAEGKLHAFTDKTLYRFDEGKWVPIAFFNWEGSYKTLAFDGKGQLWAGTYGAVYRFHEGPSTVFSEDCKTPFVYLYDVSPRNNDQFTFPSTQKALSSLSEVSKLHLVDFKEGEGRRHLGIPVASKAQGEAVIAHVKASMKDEDPKLLCYAPPRDARKIEITPKKK